MKIRNKIRAVVVLAVVGAGLAAGATETAAAAPFACTATAVASDTGYTVSWTGEVPGAWRYVVERNTDGGWAWRGRTQAPGSTFADSGPPLRSIRLEYRVKVLGADRAVLTTAGCTVVFSQTFSCSMRAFELGETQVRWDPALGDSLDYVVLAQPDGADQLYWQDRTEATSYRLARPLSLRPPSQVRVTARDGKRIVGSALCTQWNETPGLQPYCTATYDSFFKWFGGIHSSISFNGAPRDRVLDWYRQLAPGEPWELRYSNQPIVGGGFFQGETAPPGAPIGPILYRLEMWDESHTTLLDSQICDGRANSTRSRRN